MNEARTAEMNAILEASRKLPIRQRLDVISREFAKWSADIDTHAREVDAFIERLRTDPA